MTFSVQRNRTGDGGPGPVSARLRKALLDLPTGKAPYPHGWLHRLPGC